MALKLIPSVRDGGPPDVMQLTSTPMPATIRESHPGEASVSLSAPATDPLGAVPVRRVVRSAFEVADWFLGFGEVLFDYLAGPGPARRAE